MSKLWRVISDGETEQVLLETSAENVTVADTGEKLEATTVEGALSELADGVNEARRANIVDVGQGIPTTENGNTITPVNFIFSNGTNKTVNIYAKQGEKGDTGATGAKIVSTDLIGHTDGGDNIYQQTFDNGTKAKFIAPKGDDGVNDYEELTSQPIIYAILNSISNPVENTYYKHIGATTERFINGYIYLYTGGEYKAIDGSGSGGGGSANYTKIESTIPTTAWVSNTPSWIGQNALTWNTYYNGYYIQGGTEDLGLAAGGSYSAVLTIDGTDYDAENAQAMNSDGMVMFVAYFNNHSAMLQIIDHCSGVGDSGPIAGNGYLVMVMPMSETVPSSIIVKSFSGAGGISAIISNSAIKVNSAVTMYIDYNGKIKAAGKADGSLTVSANAIPTVDIPYAIEITDTNTEGLFEVINSYVPTIPETPTALPQKTSAVKTGTWTAGKEHINIFDNDITSTSDVDVNISHNFEVIGELANSGAFTLASDVAPTREIQFTYKVKQTNGTGQINIINSYIPILPPTVVYSVNGQSGEVTVPLSKIKTITNTSTNVSITGSESPYLFTVSDSDVTTSNFIRLYPADSTTETWLNENTLSGIITEASGTFTFKVGTNTLPTSFSIKYIIESPQ